MEREWQKESLEAGEVALAAEAPAAGQTVEVLAPQGPLGLVFQRDSTALSRIKDSSPLLHKVQVVRLTWLKLKREKIPNILFTIWSIQFIFKTVTDMS